MGPKSHHYTLYTTIKLAHSGISYIAFGMCRRLLCTKFSKLKTLNFVPTTIAKKSKRSLDFLEFLSWCCGTATQQSLDSIIMNENQLKNNLERISRGLSDTLKDFGLNSIYFQNYSRQISNAFNNVHSALNKLKENQIFEMSNFQHLSDEQDAILALLHQHFKITSEIFHTLKINQISNSCLNNQIPTSIIPPEVLSADLRKLNKLLSLDNREIASNLASTEDFYSLPITDCSFVGNKIIIHIQIPIIKKGHKWTLFELITAPFAWGNQTCTLIHEHMYLATNTLPTPRTNILPILRPVSGLALHHCQPFKNRLCFLPRVSTDPFYGPTCTTKMFRGASVNELSKHCPMKCQQEKTMTVTEVEEDEFVITHPTTNTHITCKNGTTTIDNQYLKNPGAILLSLPCDCQLVENQEIMIHSRYPCNKNTTQGPEIHHVIPAMWSTLHSYMIFPHNWKNQLVYKNFSECFNSKWPLTTPHFNISTKEHLVDLQMALQDAILDATTFGTQGFHLSIFLIIWNVAITITLAYTVRALHTQKTLKHQSPPQSRKTRLGIGKITMPSGEEIPIELTRSTLELENT